MRSVSSIKKRKLKVEYDVFLPGELVDLVVPNERSIFVDGWYKWFNDLPLTRNMEQGMFPNSPEKQQDFLADLRRSKDRFGLMIKPKDKDFVIGVASFSKINHAARQADFAMVIAKKLPEFKSAFYGMETKCLMTEHALEVLGLERINSTQSIILKEWQRWQILFGYKIEGIMRKAFRKGHKTYDVILSSCLIEDYLALKDLRGGKLWPGVEKIMELIRHLPKESLEERINKLLTKTVSEYVAGIRMI